MDIIPAMDIISGECVRLTRGDYGTKKVYSKSPSDVARMFHDYGFTRLHLVDLDGAKAGYPRNLKTLEQIASSVPLRIQFGGGLKSEDSLKDALNAGASKVICGTVALREPVKFSNWIKKYSDEKIILGADFRGESVAVNGWQLQIKTPLREVVEKFYREGLKELIATDITRDGMLEGINPDIYYKIKDEFPLLRITISGGISSLEDIEKIDCAKIEGVIVGKAIYEGKITLKDLSKCWQKE